MSAGTGTGQGRSSIVPAAWAGPGSPTEPTTARATVKSVIHWRTGFASLPKSVLIGDLVSTYEISGDHGRTLAFLAE
ncbi:hypothetical protein Acor_05870 [Acrocarpospora corrugata]|uniref:Uncharacterized protein n=1 Tax=Acrocarpospora corrugata TaxID=35763 RepID=A0A5M3VPE4_9ACTN|nr:hypothetical protein Acor_05870 [Acrocarpospora corrugata]